MTHRVQVGFFLRAGDPLEDRDSRKDSSGSLFACGGPLRIVENS
jgi:hypothetical protein